MVFIQSYNNVIKVMSSENEKVIQNHGLSTKLSSYTPKVINNAVICLGPLGGGSGEDGDCLGWVAQVLIGCSQGALWCG